MPDSALLDVQFGLEDIRHAWAESAGRPFVLLYEDRGWKVNLGDFVSLANYFPPDVLPAPPPLVPPPHPRKSK